jgi:hypothetical protein
VLDLVLEPQVLVPLKQALVLQQVLVRQVLSGRSLRQQERQTPLSVLQQRCRAAKPLLVRPVGQVLPPEQLRHSSKGWPKA